jgi:hypothetical protein
VAAYVALATGIGISLPTATYLRAMLFVVRGVIAFHYCKTTAEFNCAGSQPAVIIRWSGVSETIDK